MKFCRAMILISALFLVAACSQTTRGIDPCDVLVNIPEAPAEVNAILVQKARSTAQGLVQNKLRVKKFKCG